MARLSRLCSGQRCAHLLIGKHAQVLFKTSTGDFIETWIQFIPFLHCHMMDCYAHKFGLDFDAEKFDSLFIPFYNSLSLEDLPITIYVPVIFCTSNVESTAFRLMTGYRLNDSEMRFSCRAT